jgi:hypothetical protein
MIEVKITKRKHAVYLNWFGANDQYTSSSGPIVGKWDIL